MAVTRKPQPTKTLDPSSIDGEAVIAKGGSVARHRDVTVDTPVKTIPLRLSVTLLEQIDRAVRAQPIKMPRNTWVLHAVLEKLEREAP